MDRIDLIIDALEDALDECVKPTTTKVTEALAAARELKALKPVMEQAKESLDLAQSLLENSRHHQQILYAYLAVKHALDEVTK
jgi:predicted component of type VI protein secretion system